MGMKRLFFGGGAFPVSSHIFVSACNLVECIKTGGVLGFGQIHRRFHSDFFHRSVTQHIEHNLYTELESHAERLSIREHVDFPLGGHVILE